MRYSLMVAGLVAGLLAMPAMADMKIGVADLQMAMQNSDVAKKAILKFQGDSKVQADRMGQLKTELETLDARAKKDGAVMSPKDKQDLQRQMESKLQEYQNLGQTLQRRTQEVQNDVLQQLLPKIDAILEDLQKTEKYNLIVDRKAVFQADPAMDLTKKITERLNAVTAGGAAPSTGKPAK